MKNVHVHRHYVDSSKYHNNLEIIFNVSSEKIRVMRPMLLPSWFIKSNGIN